MGKVEPEELLAEHRDAVADFRGDRELQVKRATLRELAAENVEMSRRMVSQTSRSSSYGPLFLFVPILFGAFTVFHRPGIPPWAQPAVICFGAIMYAAMRWSVLPSRVPRAVRSAPMLAMMILPMFAITWIGNRRQAVTKALDGIEAAVANGLPSDAEADRIVERGPRACRPVLRRFSSPTTSPDAKTELHRILVRLNGTDLGPGPEAWQDWCSGVMEAK